MDYVGGASSANPEPKSISLSSAESNPLVISSYLDQSNDSQSRCLSSAPLGNLKEKVEQSWTIVQGRRDRDLSSTKVASSQQPDNNSELDAHSLSSSVRSEKTTLPRRDLTRYDVAALIINKQIGTGILTTPSLVLMQTRSKTTALILWIVGGVWSALSVLMYIEFGNAYPVNGGELIYLDEIFYKPHLLMTIVFSIFFIFIPNTWGNAIQFAKFTTLAFQPDFESSIFDSGLVGLLAFCILTFVCLLHYFSRDSGLFLNRLLASYKIVLLVVLLIGGFVVSRSCEDCRGDWHTQYETEPSNPMAGLVYVIYAYEGWENANYVVGELAIDSNELRSGAFMAVLLTSLLYTMVVASIYTGCSFDYLTRDSATTIASFFGQTVFPETGLRAIGVLFSLSALGQLIAVIYTSVRVKEQIARQRLIPFSKFFASFDKQFMTPYGALVLHWVVATVWIIAARSDGSGYAFVIGLWTYGELFIGLLIAAAYPFISRAKARDASSRNVVIIEAWKPYLIKYAWLRWPIATLYFGFNSLVLVEGARGQSAGFPQWHHPFSIGIIIGFGVAYWSVVYLLLRVSGDKSPLQIEEYKLNDDGSFPPEMDDHERDMLEKSKVMGNTRILVYNFHGVLADLVKSIDRQSTRLWRTIKR